MAGWGDKLTYTEGQELIDQNNWYKLSYWNSPGANWSETTGHTLHCNGIGTGSLNKLNFWQVGHMYKVTITLTYTAGGGELRPVQDNTHASRLFGVGANGTFTYFIPCSSV